MAYANFDLKTAVHRFELSEERRKDVFTPIEPIEPSEILRGIMDEFAPVALAINTEQARREYIISPILMEAKRRSEVEVNVFPGVMFTVDEARGLSGYCDYLIARSPKIYYLEAPVVAIVEAKREDLTAGLGQCVAEMVAIQIFNEKEGRPRPVVYGSVTNGSNWRFLKLNGKDLLIDDKEYFMDELAEILGILVSFARG